MRVVGNLQRDSDGADAFAPGLVQTVEVDLGTPAKRSGSFTIAGAGWTVGKPVTIGIAAGPYTGKGYASPDEAQFYEMTLGAIVTAANLISVWWSSGARVRGNVKFNYAVGG